MEQPTPMDRLLCGDVGYGKTEVAMRAAFKAVMEGKQAAVLTPTTVLAYQHYDTFRSRFAPFPVKIELLSRFRSAKEQKEVTKRVESGEVDVVIGTHRFVVERCSLQRAGHRCGRRGTAFWCGAQRETQASEEARRCFDSVRNADTTHA